MKIDINNLGANQKVDTEKISYGNSQRINSTRMLDSVGGIALDISGTVTDNNAYGIEDLKSVEEVMQTAGETQVTLQRNYMAVMSNSMSAEDFAQLQEDGFSLTDTTVENQVTTLDKIKVKLAESGTIIEGYNDDFSSEELTEILGNNAYAESLSNSFRDNDIPLNEENVDNIKEALNKSLKVKEFSDDLKAYMLNNHLEPSISNLYKAQFSAGISNGRQAKGFYSDTTHGYYAKKADDFDLSQIIGQIEKIIDNSGLTIDENTMKEAEWIIRKGLPLTEDTMLNYNRLNKITLPITDSQVVELSVNAINDHVLPVDYPVDKVQSDLSLSKYYVNIVKEIDDNAITEVVKNNEVLNISNLSKESNAQGKLIDISKLSKEELSAKRLLEETRLLMSQDANLRLLKKGIAIEITPLNELVEELKEAERSYYEPFFINEDEASKDNKVEILDKKIDLYKSSVHIFEKLRDVPSEVLAKVDSSSDDFNANNLLEQGEKLKAVYNKLEKSYEPLMTAPRADLGDSIKKAFRNTDDILRDYDFELNEENRKSVRILGYSGTEINEANIDKVRGALRAVSHVYELMTPRKTLEIIRNGHNPIDDNIYKLEDELSKEDLSVDADKYSRFLRKLDDKHEITDNEKQAFIGIYRLFRQIEKSDGALIGNVLKEGGELTLRNLLNASRSNRAKGRDYRIDDNFGLLSEIKNADNSISDDIDKGFGNRSGSQKENYYTSLAKEALDKMSPDSLINAEVSGDMTLETLSNDIIDKFDFEYDDRTRKEELKLLNEARNVTDEVLKELDSYGEPVTVNNILAFSDIINRRGQSQKRLVREADRFNQREKIKQLSDKVIQDFNSKEDALKEYEEFIQGASEIISEAVDYSDNAVNVKELALLNKQLSIMGDLAKKQNYEVPMELGDEWTTINLTIISDSEETGTVLTSLETEELGKVEAKFEINGKEVKGFILSNNQATVDLLTRNKERIADNITGNGRVLRELNFVRSDKMKINDYLKNNGENTASTSDLYEVGKGILTSIKELV